MISNFHTHCHFCHGKGHPEEYIEQALEKEFSALGFSCHAPVPFFSDWNMSIGNAEKYVHTINTLKNKYKNRIQIYNGMEIDYLKGDTSDIFKKYDLDYKIGSVHFVNGATRKEYHGVDSSPKEFEKILNKYFGSDIKKLVFQYYDCVLEMLKYNKIDMLGHLDLIKKNNTNGKYFSQTDKWYVNLLKEVVENISKYDVIVEVNTGGISRGYIDETYPSQWIIKECRDWNIPITISSDAHAPHNVDFYFEEAKLVVQSAGYDEIWEINNGMWVSKPL